MTFSIYVDTSSGTNIKNILYTTITKRLFFIAVQHYIQSNNHQIRIRNRRPIIRPYNTKEKEKECIGAKARQDFNTDKATHQKNDQTGIYYTYKNVSPL